MSTIAYEASSLPLVSHSSDVAPANPLLVTCPACRADVGSLRPNEAATQLKCRACGFVIQRARGIWRALAPSREDKFRQFVKEYQTVRLKEARGTGGARYFLSLPYRDVTGRNTWQWKIRGRFFADLKKITPMPWIFWTLEQGIAG